MAPTIYHIDPDPDTVIILRYPCTDFARWEPVSTALEQAAEDPHPEEDDDDGLVDNESETGTGASSKIHEDGSDNDAPPPVVDPSKTLEPDEEGILYYVSSRHLMLASPMFRSMLTKGRFAESSRDAPDGLFHIYTDDWDPDAFLSVLRVLHLRNKQVQRTVDLEMLAKIAVIVDYYSCEDALSLFAEIWIAGLEDVPTPETYDRNLVLWMWVAWVFDVKDRFAHATAIAMWQSTESLRTLNLGLMKISDELDANRYQAFECIIQRLHELLDTYRSTDYACSHSIDQSFQCGSFLLGALTKEMDAIALLKPRPEVPFQGLSLQGVCGKLHAMKSLTWYSDRNSHHPCTLRAAIKPIIREASARLRGLDVITLKNGGPGA